MTRPAAIATLAGCCACALADPLAPVTPGDGARVLRGDATRFIGFEQSEGYSIAPLAPQNGWREFPGSAGLGSAVVGVGSASEQSLFLSDNPRVQNGLFIGGLSPTLDDPGRRGVFTIDTRIDDLAGGSYTVIGQSLELNGISFRLVFEFGGTMFVFDDTPAGLRFVDTNVFFERGVWREVRVEWAPGETRYFYGDELIYTSTSERFARGVDQVVLASDGWQDAGLPVGPGPIGAYFDNIRLDIPAAWTGAPLALACVAFARRRRYPVLDAGPAAGGQLVRVS